MTKTCLLPMIASVLLVPAASAAGSPTAPAEPISRTVFVTATDSKGAPITDLTPADFVVKEGGKEREIAKAEPATARMRLALAVEERLMADSSVRVGLFEFIKRLGDTAEVAFITIGLRNTTVVDYTSNLNAHVDAINRYTLNPSKDSQVGEGVLELASRFAEAKPERPVIVAVAISGGQAGVDPRAVTEKVRQSRATMFSATLDAGSDVSAGVGAMGDHSSREQILGDGPKQSGGRRVDVPSTGAIPKALQQIANDLLAQYAITYTLPDGVKPDKRFSISTKRRGVSLRAPSAIADR
jgi:hypothetical protein